MNPILQFGLETMGAMGQLTSDSAAFYTQALIVLYSAIDTLAWSNVGTENVTRSDFCAWVNTYMTPEVKLGCSAEDLYGARCALLHSGTSESDLSRKGRATALWYGASRNAVSALELHALRVGAKAKVIHVPTLMGVFADGLWAFLQDVAQDPHRHQEVAARVSKWLRFVPTTNLEHWTSARLDV